MTTPELVPAQAAALFVALLLAMERLNESGTSTPCQTMPAAWNADAALSDRRAAAEACTFCPLLEVCGTYADAADERWHVWAGRDRSLRPTKRKAVA